MDLVIKRTQLPYCQFLSPFVLLYRSIGLLCVFIVSLLYRASKEATKSMSLPLTACAVFLIPLFKCDHLCPFSTYSHTRSWVIGSLSAQTVNCYTVSTYSPTERHGFCYLLLTASIAAVINPIEPARGTIQSK